MPCGSGSFSLGFSLGGKPWAFFVEDDPDDALASKPWVKDCSDETLEINNALERVQTFLANVQQYRCPPGPGYNPHRFVELYGGTIIEPTAFPPDPVTARCPYYYDAITNRMYRRVVTVRDKENGIITAHWQPISDC